MTLRKRKAPGNRGLRFEKPRKYSINLWGHATSITLEPAFWDLLCQVADRRCASVKSVLESIDKVRTEIPSPPNLSCCVRLWLIDQGAFDHDKLK